MVYMAEVTAEMWESAAEAAAKPGIHYRPGFRERVSSFVNNLRGAKIFGFPVELFLIGAAGGAIVKGTLKSGLTATGLFGGAGVAAAAGAIWETGKEYLKQRGSGALETGVSTEKGIRANLKNELLRLGNTDKKKLAIAAAKGAAMGTLGFGFGAYALPEIISFVQEHVPLPDLSHLNPFAAPETSGPATPPPAATETSLIPPQSADIPAAPAETPTPTATAVPTETPAIATPEPVSPPLAPETPQPAGPPGPETVPPAAPAPATPPAGALEPSPGPAEGAPEALKPAPSPLEKPPHEAVFGDHPPINEVKLPAGSNTWTEVQKHMTDEMARFGKVPTDSQLREAVARALVDSHIDDPTHLTPGFPINMSGVNEVMGRVLAETPLLPPEIAAMPDITYLSPGSDLWKESAKILANAAQISGQTLSDAQMNEGILELDKQICLINNIAVPEWGLPGDKLATELPIGQPIKMGLPIKQLVVSIVNRR